MQVKQEQTPKQEKKANENKTKQNKNLTYTKDHTDGGLFAILDRTITKR